MRWRPPPDGRATTTILSMSCTSSPRSAPTSCTSFRRALTSTRCAGSPRRSPSFAEVLKVSGPSPNAEEGPDWWSRSVLLRTAPRSVVRTGAGRGAGLAGVLRLRGGSRDLLGRLLLRNLLVDCALVFVGVLLAHLRFGRGLNAHRSRLVACTRLVLLRGVLLGAGS